jgi:site-specific DNA-methyltransferase (adenine-specific)
MWVFGSFRMFFGHAADFEGWSFAQEIVWEKQNGSSFHSDRFKRVHELCAQFYLGEWGQVYKNPVKTLDATARITRRKTRPPHTGNIGAMAYVSEDGGPRLQRSIIRAPNCHGYAEHPTQKPEAVVSQLCEYSGPPHGSLFSPFLGSGTDLVVAKRHGLRAVGCDVDERYCEIAANRLRQGVLDLTPALV